MVGSNNAGTMNDNQNEGHPGWILGQVKDSALPNIVPDQPNLVIINVGTNNAIQNNGVSTIADEFIQVCSFFQRHFCCKQPSPECQSSV